MEELFLSEEQIRYLTTHKNKECQRKWLNQNGIRYLVSADGSNKILRQHLNQVMGCGDKVTERKRTQPNLDGLLKHQGTY